MVATDLFYSVLFLHGKKTYYKKENSKEKNCPKAGGCARGDKATSREFDEASVLRQQTGRRKEKGRA
jgi:hypothetical protein